MPHFLVRVFSIYARIPHMKKSHVLAIIRMRGVCVRVYVSDTHVLAIKLLRPFNSPLNHPTLNVGFDLISYPTIHQIHYLRVVWHKNCKNLKNDEDLDLFFHISPMV